MPGIVTHHTFGREIYDMCASEIGRGDVEREAFLLGCQGPDPLFAFTVVLPDTMPEKKLGSVMHTQKTSELLCAFHRHLISGEAANSTTRAYALGFLCHYLLDSTIHPLVDAQQAAITAHSPEELKTDEMKSVIHSTIETEIDEYIYSSKLNETVSSMPPHRYMLNSSQDALLDISACVAQVVEDVYDMTISSMLFHNAVWLFRIAQSMLDSKANGLRGYLDYLEPLQLASAHIKSLSHVDQYRKSTVFANNDHVPWKCAFDDEQYVSASFDELYISAFERSIDDIPRFIDNGPVLAICSDLSRGVDFRGRPATST